MSISSDVLLYAEVLSSIGILKATCLG